MVLSSSKTEDTTFGSSDSDDAYNTAGPGAYPPHPPIASFLGLTSGSFTQEAKKRFTERQLAVAEREFGFHPTPLEREGLAYYNAVFYAAESKGALYGTLAGCAVGFLMTRRQRNIGFLFRGIGNRLGAPHRWQLLASRTANFAFVVAVARLWGITSYGVRAYNQTSRMQREDPNMMRYLEARDRRLVRRREEGRAGIASAVGREARTEQAEGGGDPQSLGGPDFYEDRRPADGNVAEDDGERRRVIMEATANLRRTRETAAAAEKARQEASERNDNDDDPFFGDSEPAQPEATPIVRTTENTPSGSAWDRLRRGQQGDAAADRDGSTASAWTRRPATKGFEQSEAKEDSFSFSTGDRERAKEEAQRMFDERVERERRGEGKDGFAKEVEHNGRGR